MIEIHLDTQSARRLDGMRRWLAYVQTEVISKMGSSVKLKDSRPNMQTYAIGDSLCTFETSTSENGTMLNIKLSTRDRSGKESTAAPVPALVILMVVLHLVGGRANAGAMIALQATIGSKNYNTKQQVPEIYATLKKMLPPEWYMPFTEGIKASDEFFKRAP